jgi:shikimate kinase
MITPPTSVPRLVLVGTMGAGKTTVGLRLADLWGVGFRDTDHDVEASAGRAVAEIFVDSGEARFRELERDAVLAALDGHDGVLALGGGALMNEATRSALSGHRVVFLRVGLADAARRVGLGVSRPMLLGNVRARIKQLIDERTPIYESVATYVVDTDGLGIDEVVERVRSAVEPGVDAVVENGEHV